MADSSAVFAAIQALIPKTSRGAVDQHFRGGTQTIIG
jgi:hypothetical protein